LLPAPDGQRAVELQLRAETRRGTACVIAIDTSRTMKGEPFASALEAAGAVVLLSAGVSALLYPRRRHRRSNAVDRTATSEMREVATAHDESVPALPRDRVIMP